MRTLEKLQTLVILLSISLGLLLGQLHIIEQYADYFIIPFLFVMLYGLFLTIPLKPLKKAFLNYKFLSTSTIINFIWTPLLAWGLGFLFLSEHPALWMGFIMLMVTPCTDWYLIFTGVAKGNVPLSTALLPVNVILQVLLLPVYLLIFAGTVETVELSTVLESVILVLVAPFALALLSRYVLKKKESFLKNKWTPFFGSGQVFFLALAIMAMFASQGSYLLENLNVLYILLIPVLLYFVINYVLARLIGRFLKFSYENTASLTLTIIARNSPVALAIAVTAFPDQPLIALALVIGPLIELPVLAIISGLLLFTRKNQKATSI
ncbi:arsenic resistance protein [Shouchella shacheensis]|uniref:arsenic resistance protein n=1 Tax=Shouchella shacheensis TaxID=1649580 RepID=UPI0007403E2E|nr:arsenic resistance protein [Shouchella shacheensis]